MFPFYLNWRYEHILLKNNENFPHLVQIYYIDVESNFDFRPNLSLPMILRYRANKLKQEVVLNVSK